VQFGDQCRFVLDVARGIVTVDREGVRIWVILRSSGTRPPGMVGILESLGRAREGELVGILFLELLPDAIRALALFGLQRLVCVDQCLVVTGLVFFVGDAEPYDAARGVRTNAAQPMQIDFTKIVLRDLVAPIRGLLVGVERTGVILVAHVFQRDAFVVLARK